MDFQIKKGETIALVGSNGSGKSTLVKLLADFYRPDGGELLFYGKNYKDYPEGSINHFIGMFFQDFYLFHLTLRENVGFGSLKHLKEDSLICEALRKSGALPLLEKCSEGLEQWLKKDVRKTGILLSGGEQQKIAVSRTHMSDKEILIFDEPAAALDPIAEMEQFRNIKKKTEGRTAILISHRVGFARMADRILADETFRFRTKWMEEGALAIHMFHLCSSSDHGIQEVRHYELSDYLKARWRAVTDAYIQKKNKLVAKHLRFNLLADFLRSGVYLVILLVTAWAIYQSPVLGLGVFTLVYTLAGRLQQATGNIFTAIMRFSASLSYMNEFFALGNLERDVKEEGETREGNNLPRSYDKPYGIEFEHVSFTYPGTGGEVLHDICLSIPQGEKIAVVGENGSGKSTFISLLTGMFSPDKGEVKIGGLNMEEHKGLIRRKISVISQDFARYEASLRENITVSDAARCLSDEEILELAKQIHVEDVILEQPERLDGMLGHLSQKGNTLSGG